MKAPERLGQRGNFIRDSKPSPMPVGYEDIDPSAYIELKRNGEPVMYHQGYYYRMDNNHKSDHLASWASRMNKEQK